MRGPTCSKTSLKKQATSRAHILKMDLDTLKTTAFAKLRSTQLAYDRGYMVDPSRYVDGALNDSIVWSTAEGLWNASLRYTQSLAESASETFTSKDPDGPYLHVIFLDKNYDLSKRKSKMTSTDQVKALKNKMTDLGSSGLTDHFVVISPSKWSPQAKKEDLSMFPNTTFFQYEDLLIRVPKHELYVPHVVIQEADLKQQVSPYLDAVDLPMIRKSDPVVRWFGFPVGSILHVQRPGFSAYRRIVP